MCGIYQQNQHDTSKDFNSWISLKVLCSKVMASFTSSISEVCLGNNLHQIVSEAHNIKILFHLLMYTPFSSEHKES